MKPMITLALIALIVSACSEPSTPAESSPVIAPAKAAAVPMPRHLSHSEYLVLFGDDQLLECMSVIMAFTVPADMPEWELPPFDITDKIEAEGAVSVDSCSPFEDRTRLARCIIRHEQEAESGLRVVAAVTTRHYAFPSGNGDAQMRDCIEGGGEWTALSRDSREYRRAELQRGLGDARRTLADLRRRR